MRQVTSILVDLMAIKPHLAQIFPLSWFCVHVLFALMSAWPTWILLKGFVEMEIGARSF